MIINEITWYKKQTEFYTKELEWHKKDLEFFKTDKDKGEECDKELICKIGNDEWKGDKKRKKCSPINPNGDCGFEKGTMTPPTDGTTPPADSEEKFVV